MGCIPSSYIAPVHGGEDVELPSLQDDAHPFGVLDNGKRERVRRFLLLEIAHHGLAHGRGRSLRTARTKSEKKKKGKKLTEERKH